MDATLFDIRLARPDDLEGLRSSVRRTLNNPEGKAQRKKFADAIERGELLILTHHERGAGGDTVEGFVEWHSRVDGGVTIRDAGVSGDELNSGNVKRLVRELLRMTQPPIASVKVDAELAVWNSVFSETPGFRLEGREYSQRKWLQIWTWTPAADTLDRQRTASQRAVGRPVPRR
jgi:hypothetical protein